MKRTIQYILITLLFIGIIAGLTTLGSIASGLAWYEALSCVLLLIVGIRILLGLTAVCIKFMLSE